VLQSISPGIVKTDFMTSVGSKIVTPEAAYSSTPHLLPEDITEMVMFALGRPPHVQVSHGRRCSKQLDSLSATAVNYRLQCVSVSPNGQCGMSTPLVVYSGFFRGWGLRQEFFSGCRVQQIQLRIEGRENGDLGAVAP
jgi:hypothetical protein